MLFPANLLANNEKIKIKARRKENHNNIINLGHELLQSPTSLFCQQ